MKDGGRYDVCSAGNTAGTNGKGVESIPWGSEKRASCISAPLEFSHCMFLHIARHSFNPLRLFPRQLHRSKSLPQTETISSQTNPAEQGATARQVNRPGPTIYSPSLPSPKPDSPPSQTLTRSPTHPSASRSRRIISAHANPPAPPARSPRPRV